MHRYSWTVNKSNVFTLSANSSKTVDDQRSGDDAVLSIKIGQKNAMTLCSVSRLFYFNKN